MGVVYQAHTQVVTTLATHRGHLQQLPEPLASCVLFGQRFQFRRHAVLANLASQSVLAVHKLVVPALQVDIVEVLHSVAPVSELLERERRRDAKPLLPTPILGS